MEKEKEQYKFKFINRAVPIDFVSNIGQEFNELKECLKSENIDLSAADVFRFFDIYLRLVGLGRTAQDDTEFQGILSQCAPVNCNNIVEKFKNPEVEESFKKGIIASNELMEIGFDDVDTIVSNIPTIMKEYSVFWNDLVNYSFYYITNSSCNTYTLEATFPNDITKLFKMSTFKDGKLGNSILIFSTINSMNLPNGVSVVVDTYPKEIADMMLASEEEKEEQNE